MFGNAGVFARFSYIKPFMLNVSGFAESKMMLIMMLAGLGMVVGNLLSGKISGRYSPRIAAMTDGVIAVTLLLILPSVNTKSLRWRWRFSAARDYSPCQRRCRSYCRTPKAARCWGRPGTDRL